MKGFIKQTVLALGCAAAFVATQGCGGYHNIVDPCYPERYEHMARQEVNGNIAPQVHNGHVLDQTVWNYHFEANSDRLTPGGLEQLAYLARRRPAADPVLYLQTALDIGPYDPANPRQLADRRAELDNLRTQAIQNFLSAHTAGRQMSFQVVVHDPAQVGMSATAANQSIQSIYRTGTGTLPATAGAGSSNVSGGAGAAAGPGR